MLEREPVHNIYRHVINHFKWWAFFGIFYYSVIALFLFARFPAVWTNEIAILHQTNGNCHFTIISHHRPYLNLNTIICPYNNSIPSLLFMRTCLFCNSGIKTMASSCSALICLRIDFRFVHTRKSCLSFLPLIIQINFLNRSTEDRDSNRIQCFSLFCYGVSDYTDKYQIWRVFHGN